MPAAEFFHSLTEADQAKLLALFRWFAEQWRISNREKFKKVEGSDGLFEFKSHQLRFIGAYGARAEFVVAHGLRKKQDRLPPEAQATALRILKEDAQRHRL